MHFLALIGVALDLGAVKRVIPSSTGRSLSVVVQRVHSAGWPMHERHVTLLEYSGILGT